MHQSEQINELISALSKAQGEITGASKDSKNPFFNSKYADLNSVWNACRSCLSKYELAVVQTTNIIDSELALVTTLAHSSGQWMKSFLPIKLYSSKDSDLNKSTSAKRVNEMQELGSCLTYLRRYALAAIVGVAPDEDDDGNSGGNSYKYSKNEDQQQKKNTQETQLHSVVNKIVSKEQAQTLLEVLACCSPQYQATIHERMKELNIDSPYRLPITVYDKLMPTLIKKSKEYTDIQAKEKEKENQEILAVA